MKVQVRYFASIREALGTGEMLEMPGDTSAGVARDMLIALDATHADALSRHRALRCAVGHVLCDETTPIKDGDELAFFPPVTGG